MFVSHRWVHGKAVLSTNAPGAARDVQSPWSGARWIYV